MKSPNICVTVFKLPCVIIFTPAIDRTEKEPLRTSAIGDKPGFGESRLNSARCHSAALILPK